MYPTTLLPTFGFENSIDEPNLYYRHAEDGNYDVIRYMPYDELYNICIEDANYDFIDEKQLLALLTR